MEPYSRQTWTKHLTDKAPYQAHLNPDHRGFFRNSNHPPLQNGSWKETFTGKQNHVEFIIQMCNAMKLLLK